MDGLISYYTEKSIRAKFDKRLRAHASTFSPFPPVAMDELRVAWNNEK